jgi:hypothetical protein
VYLNAVVENQADAPVIQKMCTIPRAAPQAAKVLVGDAQQLTRGKSVNTHLAIEASKPYLIEEAVVNES